jgi:HEAT repeat protein
MNAQLDAARKPVGVSQLGKTLLLGRDASLRAWAARSLGERGQISAYAYLRHALWDPAEAVRQSAVEAIAELAVIQAAGELADLYAWSGPHLRRTVLRAVRRIGYRSEFDGILSLAREDPDSRVRALAARAGGAGTKGRRRS